MPHIGWRGRNERTGMEGIFPRSYVNVNEKGSMPPQPTNYGNMPLEVSQGGGPSNPQSDEPSKFQQGGKKLGKKFGNAGMYTVFVIMRLQSTNLQQRFSVPVLLLVPIS